MFDSFFAPYSNNCWRATNAMLFSFYTVCYFSMLRDFNACWWIIITNYIFLGKDQVMAGVVPIGNSNLPEQSSKSVYPLAIANCKEDRYKTENSSVAHRVFI